jgi:hypothetical protein
MSTKCFVVWRFYQVDWVCKPNYRIN